MRSEVEMKNRDFDQELPQLFFRQGRQKEDDCSPCQPGTASNGKGLKILVRFLSVRFSFDNRKHRPTVWGL